MAKCTDPDFWDKRGIDPAVRDARGYEYWDVEKDPNLPAIWDAYGDLDSCPWIHAKAKEAGTGLVIKRWKPDGDYEDIKAEIRPDNPVITRRIKHYHGPPENAPDPETLHPSKVYKPEHAIVHMCKKRSDFGTLTHMGAGHTIKVFAGEGIKFSHPITVIREDAKITIEGDEVEPGDVVALLTETLTVVRDGRTIKVPATQVELDRCTG